VLEPRFNVETLALLLNIPPSKTLLRRHLATHFHLLVGAEAQRSKQDCLENPDHALLTATARMPKNASFQHGLHNYGSDGGGGHLEQMEDSEGTVRQIGVFSEEINNLTSMLQEDVFLTEGNGGQVDVAV
ncbi:hypothetical protein CRUP_011971, partial [Coryphaenoides rupestris]